MVVAVAAPVSPVVVAAPVVVVAAPSVVAVAVERRSLDEILDMVHAMEAQRRAHKP